MGSSSLWKREAISLSLVVLLAAVSVAQQFAVKTHFKVSCEGSTLSVKCDNPSHVIYIQDAYYGRTKEEFCPTVRMPKIPCRSMASLHVIYNACQSKNSCELKVNREVMGQACAVISKYAYIKYRCEVPGRSTIGECTDHTWGAWVNIDKPNSGVGDSETFYRHRARKRTCGNPSAADFRVAATDEPYWASGNAVRLGRLFGLTCVNKFQAQGVRCTDFKVRYCCPPVTRAATCPNLRPPTNGVISSRKKRNFVVGNVVSFRCRRGYSLAGSTSIRCQAGGVWSQQVPTCKKPVRITCSYKGKIPNGRRRPTRSRFNMGQQMRFICQRGYRLVGKATMVCGKDGWDSPAPSCIKIEARSQPKPKKLTICRGIGDPHYTTFDQKKFDFMGECSYTFTRYTGDELEKFDIEVFNIHRGRKTTVSWLGKAVVTVFGDIINFNPGPQFRVNGELINLPYTSPKGYTIVKQGRFGVLTTSYKLTVKFDGRHSLIVGVPPEYFGGKLEGLCGNFDGDASNDIVVNGVEDPNAHGNKYLTPSKTDCVSEDLQDSGCSKLENTQKYRVDCAVINDKSGPFKNCHTAATPENFFTDCVFDVCVYGGTKLALEQAVAAYAQACNEADAPVGPWRDVTNTPLTCPPNSQYSSCASLCPATCVEPNPTCEKGCVEGCVCNSGFVLSGDNCVRTERCGCSFEGKYFLNGESFLQDSCSKRCTCKNQRMTCVDTSCRRRETCAKDNKGRESCQPTINLVHHQPKADRHRVFSENFSGHS